MTCLTLTPQSVAEAIESQAQMVVAHHPLPFKPIAKLTTQSQSGRMLWDLARAGISVYSPHTAWDSAGRGINARLAELLGLEDCQPIVPQRVTSQSTPTFAGTAAAHSSVKQTEKSVAVRKGEPVDDSSDTVDSGRKSTRLPLPEDAVPGRKSTRLPLPEVGAGRMGSLSEPLSLHELTSRLCQRVADCRPRGVNGGQLIRGVAIACGSGGSLLGNALATGKCDLFLTGEGTFHTCLEAQAAGISLLMIGHFASERFAMVEMASELQHVFPELTVWASQQEKDPVENIA